jgi:hypothetical protein
MTQFTKDDVDQQKLEESVKREAQGIFEKNSRNRTFDQVYKDTEKGHIAERYLIEHWGYTDNPKLYHDVIYNDNIEVEVKVIDKKWLNEYFIETDPYHRNLKKWRESKRQYNVAEKVIVFSVDNGVYEYYNTYDL